MKVVKRIDRKEKVLLTRVANITDSSVEVRNSENDPYFSRFLYTVSKFSDFLRILQFFDLFQHFFIIIGNHYMLRPWNSWTANSDKKYMELKCKQTMCDFSESSRSER